jgi:hypothetical protein
VPLAIPPLSIFTKATPPDVNEVDSLHFLKHGKGADHENTFHFTEI